MMAQATDLFAEAREHFDGAQVRGLQGDRQPLRVVWGTALVWAQLGLAGTAALQGSWPWVLAAFVVLCACQQAMLLWVHEASHGLLFRSRGWNDGWADFWMATPLGISVRSYRAKHLTHHAYLGTAADRDRWTYIQDVRGWSGAKLLAESLSGWFGVQTALGHVTKHGDETDRHAAEPGYRIRTRLLSVVWNLGFVAACVAAGRWYLYPLLWLGPLFTVSILLNIVRTTAEHQPDGFPDQGWHDQVVAPVARTTRPNFLEKWLLYQVNFNYHFEHHLYPGVPFHHLPQIHTQLGRAGFFQRHPDQLQRSGISRVLRNALHTQSSSSGSPA